VTGRAVDRSSTAIYLHLVRAPDDPPRRQRFIDRAERDTGAWRELFRSGTQAHWTEAIRAHLADGTARTFNRIMVEIADVTSDVAFEKAPDLALWALVAAGEVEHTTATPILFRRRAP
jgi:hypothetical protein